MRCGAPNARYVNVVGDFNGWDCTKGVMSRCGTTGVWEAVLYDVKLGDCYKFAILTQSGELIFKADRSRFTVRRGRRPLRSLRT